uniref:Uncharacterized protein n=1 Tax=Graphocephala atropunctata TaxID=36148 RepID=A0A1B6KPH8_9HEMI
MHVSSTVLNHNNKLHPSNVKSDLNLFSSKIKREEEGENLGQDVRKHWEIGSLLFAAPYHEIDFTSEACQFYYLQYVCNGVPDRQLVGPVRQAYYRVLARLNQSKLQVKNFILPVQLMKFKYIDPYSRQRIIEDICRYLSSQEHLRSVVLEEASVTFADLCRFLLALNVNSHVRRLFLCGVLDRCETPLKGPLQSDIILDNLPRIPYTYNPGGRKFLKSLIAMKYKKPFVEIVLCERSHRTIKEPKKISNTTTIWMKKLLNACNIDSNQIPDPNISSIENYNRLLRTLYQLPDTREKVFFQKEVCIQCCITEDNVVGSLSRDGDFKESSASSSLAKDVVGFCRNYLKTQEYNPMDIGILREIYMLALSGLRNLTTLSINYSLLADGTGDALLSIGSVVKGRLKDLELLCEMRDTPSPTHLQYHQQARQAIPDRIWKRVLKHCPHLKVHLVCVTMSNYDITKLFITKSIPLNSLHIDNGFCPTLIKPQLMFFSTLKFLYLNFKETLEHVSILLWHSSGRIDGELEKFIKEAINLHHFEYYGPIQYKSTINRLCDAALLSSPELENFKLMVQGDPCYPHIARDLTAELYQKYKPKFDGRSIQFYLGTHNS